MATDAKFDKIQKILPHDNADSLEIAIVSNFPCVVKKGEFKEGDWCFYIRDDAQLIEYNRKKEYENRGKLGSGVMVPCDQYSPVFAWQESLLKYLGGNGRVKTTKLRGKVSMGILLKPETVLGHKNFSDLDAFLDGEMNKKILDHETGASFLERMFGVVHYVAPLGNMGEMDVKFCGLPEGLQKTDEENFENLPEEDLHLGEICLVTKKLDGTSCTVTCYPDERGYEISSRGMTFNVKRMEENGTENVYTKYTKEVVKAGLAWAKKYNKTIALRGEICCQSVQRSSYNQSCLLNDFFLYGIVLPDEENWFVKNGIYGTETHFLKIADELTELGFNVKTVPILETDVVITKELLKKYNDLPWSAGEGMVVNVKCNPTIPLNSFVWHYKSKSREYLMKMK